MKKTKTVKDVATYFIDLGGWKGDSEITLRSMQDVAEPLVIHSFEPNPKFRQYYEGKSNVVFHPLAAWIHEGCIDFYPQRKKRRRGGREDEGGSLLRKKNNVDISKPVQVKCVDFSQWLISNFNKTDYIILKLDIEGAEYQVLNKMIKDESIDYVDVLYVEFHYKRCGVSITEHNRLISKVKIPILKWP